MKITPKNPWTWQDQLGYSQAVEVINNNKTLFCSGQASMDASGRPIGGAMSKQIKKSLENLATVIAEAGYQTKHITRLNFFTTSVPDFFKDYQLIVSWMSKHACIPASTLVEVNALAYPELKVEIEATVAG